MTEKIIVYGHPACPGVPPVLGMLRQSKVDYTYINIRADAEAANRVREINNGYESVPTLIFPDETTLTEPSTRDLQQKLTTLGYHVPLQAVIIGYLPRIAIGAVIVYAILRFMGII